MPLVSVINDQNTHGGGGLLCDNNPGKLFIQGKLVGLLNCAAEVDVPGHPTGDTNPSTASSKFFVGGIPVHRHGDSRYCGASTVVSGQSKVTSG